MMEEDLGKLSEIIAEKIDNDFCLSDRGIGFILLLGKNNRSVKQTAIISNLYESAIPGCLCYAINKLDEANEKISR